MKPRNALRGLAAVALLPSMLACVALTGAFAVAAGPTPGTVFVQTSPALAGVRLSIDAATVTTGTDGSAKVAVSNINDVASRVKLATTALNPRDTLALAYVQPAAHSAAYESHLTVGLDVTSNVALQISGGTSGVAPTAIHAVRLHSVTGLTMLVDPQSTPTVSLLSRKSRLVAGTPAPQTVTWSVDSLKAVPGVSITAQQDRFDPFGNAVWSLVLRPVAGTVVVDTVPATSGVSFVIDGATFSSDAQGHATAQVADLNGLDAKLQLSTPLATGSTVSLLRVSGLPPGAPFQRHLLAALTVSRPVSLSFADTAGHEFAANRIAEVALDGGGQTVTVSGAKLNDPVTLLAEEAKLVGGTWKTQQVTYAVARVSVDGADAVFAGQQRFNPNGAGNWVISISAFDVSVTVRDVLFGSRVTSGADVTRPDGVRYAVHLSGGRPTVLRSVVRGQYTLTTRSAVLGGDSKILVSKSSEVDLRVVTLPDVLVISLVVLGAAAAVVMLGVRFTRRSGARTAEPETQVEMETQP